MAKKKKPSKRTDKVSVSIPLEPKKSASAESVTYFSTLKDSVKMLCFDEAAVGRVANSSNATRHGLLTIIIAGIISAISIAILSWGIDEYGLSDLLIGLAVGPLVYLVATFVWYSIGNFIVKKLFGGMATGVQYFRVISNAFILFWAADIAEHVPYIGSALATIFGVYLLITTIYFIHKLHKVSVGKSIISVFLPIVLVLLAIGSLAFFGVLTPDKFLPPR